MEHLIEAVSGFIIGLAVLTPIILKARNALKEIGELLIDLAKALDDGKITMEEVKSIIADAKQILGVFGKAK